MQPVAAPLVLADDRRVCALAGELVANRLRARPRMRLILPTGRTPLGMYAALRAHAADGSLPDGGATLFQLDEYLGMAGDDPRSFRATLLEELRGLSFERFHALDADAPDVEAMCARHQAFVDEAPLDLAVLGLGADGHVAFDEPGSPFGAGVRRVALHERTRADAAGDFGGLDQVPREAVTVGLRTLASARELLLLVTGERKAPALRDALEGPAGPHCPASLLRSHPRLTVVCDEAAAALLRAPAGAGSDRVVVVLGHREPHSSPEDRLSAESRARLRRAARCCRSDPPRAVVFTGYTRTLAGDSEAEQMRSAWPLDGVPALMEEAGRNTAENASRTLPLVRALGGIRRVTVVTSAWHVRTPFFFAPYRSLGLRVRFAPALGGPWRARSLATELRGLPAMARQRRRALAAMRLPPEPGALT